MSEPSQEISSPCPGLSRASTPLISAGEDMDGRLSGATLEGPRSWFRGSRETGQPGSQLVSWTGGRTNGVWFADCPSGSARRGNRRGISEPARRGPCISYMRGPRLLMVGRHLCPGNCCLLGLLPPGVRCQAWPMGPRGRDAAAANAGTPSPQGRPNAAGKPSECSR